jgi:hypothetical protein
VYYWISRSHDEGIARAEQDQLNVVGMRFLMCAGAGKLVLFFLSPWSGVYEPSSKSGDDG